VAISSELLTDEAVKTYGESNVIALRNDLKSRKSALQSKNGSEYEKRVDMALETPLGTAKLEKSIDEAFKNGVIGLTEHTALKLKISQGQTKNQFYHDVWNKRTNQEGSQSLSFGEQHYDAIDKYDQQDANSNMPLGTRLVGTLRTFGVITDRQVNEINGLLNSPDIEKQTLAVSAMGQLRENIPLQYFKSTMARLEKLNGKANVVARTVMYTGAPPEYVLSELAGADSKSYSIGRTQISTGKLGRTRDNIADSLTSFWSSDSPDYISPMANEVYNTLYDYEFSRLASLEGEGLNPLTIGAEATSLAKARMKQFVSNTDFGGKRQVISNKLVDQSLIIQMNPFANNAIEGIISSYNISSDFLLADISEINSTIIDDSEYYSIPIYNTTELARVKLGDVVIPVDDMKRKEEKTKLDAAQSGYGNIETNRKIKLESYNKYFVPTTRFKGR
jgi:hypothetical protein